MTVRIDKHKGMAQDGVGKVQGGVVKERGILTEGYQKKGGLNGPSSIPARPAPPPAFKPATGQGGSGTQPAGGTEKK